MSGRFASKTQLLAILDNMPFMAWYKDTEGRFVAINQPFADAIGKPREEIIGKTDFDVWPYEPALTYVNDDKEVMQARMKKTVEEKINDAGGGVWFETFKAPVFDDKGDVVGTIGMSKDISARIRFQMELEDQKKLFKTMIDASPDLIFFKDVNSAYLGCNQAYAQRLLGWEETEIIGKTGPDFMEDQELAAECMLKDKEVFSSGRTLVIEETVKFCDGDRVNLETAKTPFYDKEGKLAGLIGISRDITARKKFEKQLKEQSDYAQMLLQTIPSAVYTVDNDKNVMSWNIMAEKITGYTADEVIGKSVDNFHFHPCREGCQLFCEQIVAPEANLTCTIRHKDGGIKYILKNVDVLRNGQGEIIGRIECFDDVTEKVLVEEQLKESEMRLNLATSSTNIGMWDWKVQTGETVFNEQWANIIGYTLAELTPISINTWVNISHPEDLEKSGAALEKCFTGESDYYETEVRLKHKNGQWVWVLDRGKVIEWNADGKPERMVGTHIDITARKHAEEELLNRERLIAAVAMSIKELIDNPDYLKAVARCFELIGKATRVDRVYLFTNRQDEHGDWSASQVVRWEAGISGPQTVNPLMQNISLKASESLVAHLQRGEGFCSTVGEIKDDRTRAFFTGHNIKALILLPVIVRGKLWGAVGFDECKFERKWAESEYSTLSVFANSLEKTIERSLIAEELEAAKQSAEAANALKSQFVANISHEIRTPMQAILGYAALMKGNTENEQNTGYLNAIQKAGNTLTNLISDILDLSKIEAGKIELQTSEVPIEGLFDDISDIFAWRIQERNLTLNTAVDESVPKTIMLDELRARQILFNLVGNAVKFTEAGSVTVSAAARNLDSAAGTLDLVLTVADTGIGIPADQQRAIFEPFKQKDGQSNKKYGGTGLGLAISKRLIEVMGGTIEVESEPGRGATFTVTFSGVSIGKADSTARTARTKELRREAERRQAAAAKAGAAVERPVPAGLVAKLEQLRDGLWLECSRTNRVSDIKKLARVIRDAGAEYRHEETVDYADDLQAYANTFDLKNIKVHLGRFPAFVGRLKGEGGA